MNHKGKMLVIAILIILLAMPISAMPRRIASNSIQQKQLEINSIQKQVYNTSRVFVKDQNIRVFRGSNNVAPRFQAAYSSNQKRIDYRSANPSKSQRVHETVHVMADINRNLLNDIQPALSRAKSFEVNPDLNKTLTKHYEPYKNFRGKSKEQSMNEEAFARMTESYYKDPFSVRGSYPSISKKIESIFGVRR